MYHINEKELRLSMVRKDIYSLRQLAKASGLSLATLTGMLRGERSPTLGTLMKIGDALDLSGAELAAIFLSK